MPLNKKNIGVGYLLLLATMLLLGGCESLLVQQGDGENSVATAAVCDEPQDIWTRIRDGFTLEIIDSKRVKRNLEWFAGHPAYLERVVDRATPYMHLIVDELQSRGMPTEIALLPVVESAFQPFAYSHGRAAGLWQFVPGTGRRFGLRQTWWYDGRRDIAEGTRAALDYLQYLHKHFKGDWLLALAAYNSGEGTVARAIRRNKRRGKPTDYWSLNLPRETEGYVPKLLAISALVANPPAYGVLLDSIPNEPYLTTVEVGSQIDLDLAAELAGISLEEIYLYNPGFNRWATDPKGPHRLLVPIENAELFAENLAQYPDKQRIKWVRHRVRSGEVLGTLADKYHTTVSMLRSVNRLRSNRLRVGQRLTVPVARTSLRRYSLSAGQRLAAVKSRSRDGVKQEYRVQEGDTLWDIARKYEVGVRQLAKWNGMAPRDPLLPGTKLVIWTRNQEKVSAINPANFVHPFADDTTRRIGYIVRRGDSLARISQRFRVSINSLKRWNKKLNRNKYLQPGQRITLYVDVRTQSGNI
jgi:membrane-bound lytic murein transglycosylase D